MFEDRYMRAYSIVIEGAGLKGKRLEGITFYVHKRRISAGAGACEHVNHLLQHWEGKTCADQVAQR